MSDAVHLRPQICTWFKKVFSCPSLTLSASFLRLVHRYEKASKIEYPKDNNGAAIAAAEKQVSAVRIPALMEGREETCAAIPLTQLEFILSVVWMHSHHQSCRTLIIPCDSLGPLSSTAGTRRGGQAG